MDILDILLEILLKPPQPLMRLFLILLLAFHNKSAVFMIVSSLELYVVS